MKIGVCVKQVPAKDAPLAIIEGGAWIRESDIGFETNEPDSYALEEALRLKEKHGGEVVAISMGPERAKQTIKEALAKGADRGIHVADDQFFKLDPLGSARSIAAAIQAENFDLILTGLQSDDQGFGQTGVLLAELLGRPHATIIMAIEVVDGHMKLKRELEAGWFQWVELPLPAVLSIQSGINKPRYATLKGIMAREEKGNRDGAARFAGRAGSAHATRRAHLRAAQSQEDRIHHRAAKRNRREADREAETRSAGALSMKILLITEQREGKWNKVSFETLAAAQQIVQQTKGTLTRTSSSAKASRRSQTNWLAHSSMKCCSSSTTCSKNTRRTVFRSR